jgi:hypothetical protein
MTGRSRGQERGSARSGLLVPLIKDHDVVARCIVNATLKRPCACP